MPGDVQVDLWRWSLDDVSLQARGAPYLSADETDRAARFVYRRDQDRYVAGRGRLREILAGYVDAAPRALTFVYGDNGKPGLVGGGSLRFNLSHTENVAVLGVTRDIEIGVDVEGLRPVERDLPDHFFSQPERVALADLAEEAWLPAFHRCWTRKEAMIKALGDGLSIPLDSFAVSLAPDEPARLLWREGQADADAQWALAHFDGPGFIGAVAAETGGRQLNLRWISSE